MNTLNKLSAISIIEKRAQKIMISEFIECTDQKWTDFLSLCPHDFYHLPGYLEMSAEYEGGEPFAFYGQIEDVEILIPLLKRPIPTNLYSIAEPLYDVISPYGYPSPLLIFSSEGKNNSLVINQLMTTFIDMCRVDHIISAFIRLHPILRIPLLSLEEYGVVLLQGTTIAVDLQLPIEELQIRKGHRQDIQSLRKNGYTIRYNQWDVDYPQFIQLYYETMTRISASSYYFFPVAYFYTLKEVLGDHLEMAVVINENGEVVGGSLFTLYGDVVQYHLSGTTNNHTRVPSIKLILYEMILRAKQKGYKILHLGGGLGGRKDSLYSFKSGFSKWELDFYTYRIITDPLQYSYLCDAHSQLKQTNSSDDSFFPKYRQPL